MAWDHGLEIVEAPAGHGGEPRTHGEAVADRHDADPGLVDLVDQRHVGKDVGVAHVEKRLLAGRSEDDAGRIAEVDGAPVDIRSPEECQAETKATAKAPKSIRPPWLPGLMFSTPFD